MTYTYAVLGGGRQGTAAAYDMARFGDAKAVLIADVDRAAAVASAERVNRMLRTGVARAVELDVTDERRARGLPRRTSTRSCRPSPTGSTRRSPGWRSGRGPRCATSAARPISCCEQLELDEAAAKAGIAVVPDCGQVPGMGTSLMVYAMSLLDGTDDVFMWDGGNDQHPRPPFNYISTFNIAGLTNEYYGEALFLRNGKVTRVPTFQREDYEEVEFPAADRAGWRPS